MCIRVCVCVCLGVCISRTRAIRLFIKAILEIMLNFTIVHNNKEPLPTKELFEFNKKEYMEEINTTEDNKNGHSKSKRKMVGKWFGK